jgi:hypothetical protein
MAALTLDGFPNCPCLGSKKLVVFPLLFKNYRTEILPINTLVLKLVSRNASDPTKITSYFT